MDNEVIFDHRTIEFVTVAAEYCGFVEQAHNKKQNDFINQALQILPNLYLKASALLDSDLIGDSEPETFVTEDGYNFIKNSVADILGAKDDYLEVFLPDMKYSETPIKKNISEDFADIYQDLKNFIGVFQLGLNVTMNDALHICKEHFAEFWGQRLVNTLRALHDIKYSNVGEHDEDELTDDHESNEYV